jgi:glycosyltransferase involved in cell wall biosynthesis
MTPATRDLYQVGEIRDQFGFANAVIPNSETEADMLATVLDLPRDWFLPVYNGVDPQFAEPGDPAGFRQRHGLGEPFLLNIGNIEPRKNQLSLMRAAKKTGRTLVLIGHVRDRDYYRELANEGGEGLRYLGPMAHDDPMLRSAYSACDAFVLPSTLETPGLAALEAAAAGARLVVTREGSTQEYFGELATYVDPDSVDDITAGIENALRHSQSRALRDHVLARFTWPIVTGDLIKTYRTVLERAETDKVRA